MDDSLACTVTERKVYSTKADIRKFYSTLDKYEQFKLIDDDVCLDPDDEDNYFMYMNFRSKSGARLDRSIATNDFILVGDDKCGVSAVLDIPVPPGASLSIKCQHGATHVIVAFELKSLKTLVLVWCHMEKARRMSGSVVIQIHALKMVYSLERILK
jgi:hypothetical protein